MSDVDSCNRLNIAELMSLKRNTSKELNETYLYLVHNEHILINKLTDKYMLLRRIYVSFIYKCWWNIHKIT